MNDENLEMADEVDEIVEEENDVVESEQHPEPESTTQASVSEVVGRAFLAVVAVGVSAAIISGIFHPGHGSTRSSRLKWEERQQQIQQVIAESEDAIINNE